MNDAAFKAMDEKLFDRLHWGPITTITFSLVDGRTVTGHVLAVLRRGAAGLSDSTPTGEIVVGTDGDGATTLPYDQIADIM